ncbi:carboxypeptidase B-like [Anticarsia gemmatalis]|uniref:carboxypeptidase B-like n=1 Tax=Anticarsia gemmatalis TaxID=129554 RepID=UPI003F76B95B
MFNKMLFFVFVVLFGAVTANEEYKGYKVYSIELENQIQQELLHQIQSDLIDYLVKPSLKYGVTGLAMVPPSHFNWFEEQLEDLGISKEVFIEDVYEHLNEHLTKERSKRSSDDEQQETFDIKRYHRYDNILNYLRSLAAEYNTATSRVELIEFGETFEKRPLVYLRVSHMNLNLPTVQKPVIVVEGGIVPRDWITIPAVLNIVQNILAEPRFLQEYDWIVIPVVNPDGYEYTHTNLRLWTKSRSTNTDLGHICPGVNINRNFNVDWLNFDASSSPCSHVFGGTEPFSEIETKMIQSIITTYGSRIKLYLSMQNNGGFISYPWSYERAASGLFRQHFLLGLDMVDAMNETYKLDAASMIFDRASGTSSDYARDNGIFYTYNIDIVQRGSVVIPEEDIGEIIEDVWKAVAVAATGMITLP